jgi:hypothetical protein
VPPRTLTAATLGVLVLATVVRRRHSIAIARRAAIPASLACLALVLFAAPALRHGTWAVATTGNQDAYVWVSQARSLEHGPPNGPAATTPDRVPYDLLSRQSWPVAIPGSLAEFSAATWVDPVLAHGMFSAVIGAMLALAVFIGARGCLYWSQRRSAAVSIVFTGYSVRDAARARRFDTQASFEIRENSPRPSIWSDGKFAIYAINCHPGK